ncbi:MAG: BtpA/SgcQ family protein [Proteobacteria bacterium]|nr:BtpA/SgcQ family protein [Pseudomonadota bacterium]
MKFNDIFANQKPIIGCIHLLPLPGAPLYDGNLDRVYEQALLEATILEREGVHGLIIENFRDQPFFPKHVPTETVAALSSISREVIKETKLPTGINVLRNDGEAAMAIATAVGAQFIRVNVFMGAIVSEQGVIEGISHQVLRLRSSLKSSVLIFADVGVKHAAPLASRGLAMEAKDAQNRGLADALIVSGELTGAPTDLNDVATVRENSSLPILIGSGATAENVHQYYDKVDGIIVGSYFKKEGKGNNFLEAAKVRSFMQSIKK